jgi:hypothetical protein
MRSTGLHYARQQQLQQLHEKQCLTQELGSAVQANPATSGSSNTVKQTGWFKYKWDNFLNKQAFKVMDWYGKNNCTVKRIFRWQMKNRDGDGSEPSLSKWYLTKHDKWVDAGGKVTYNENGILNLWHPHPCWYEPAEKAEPQMRIAVWVGETLYLGKWALCGQNSN